MHQRRRRKAAAFSRLSPDEMICLILGGHELLAIHRRIPAEAWAEMRRRTDRHIATQSQLVDDAINQFMYININH